MAKQKYTSEDDDDLDTTIVEEKVPETDRTLQDFVQQLSKGLKRTTYLLSFWTINICIILLAFYILGRNGNPQLLEEDATALKNQQLIRYAIKGTLIFCLGWVVIMSIHDHYHNDYMKILKADNREGFKRITLLVIRVAVFYGIALKMPANHYANRLLAFLTLYIWLSQSYVQRVLRYNLHSLTKKRMQFVCNLSMNQAPVMTVLAPELPWLPGFMTLFPIFYRFTQCYVVGTHEQFLNSIKFTLNIIGFGFAVVQMPVHSHYWRILAAAYSFYWDIFRDWKWNIRYYDKNWRIDLPARFLIFGLFYDLFGRTIWVIFPMPLQDRGIVEMTRRLYWVVLRLQREQVFYFNKPKQNPVKDLDWFTE